MSKIKIILPAALGLLLAGCVGSEMYKSGKLLLEQGSCQQAIIKLTESVELSLPDKEKRTALLLAQEYRQDGRLPGTKSLNEKVRTLNQALVCAAQANLASAEAAESVGKLDTAYQLAQEAQGWMPENAYAGLIITRVKEKMEQAQEHISQAQVAGAENRWDQALALADKACSLNAAADYEQVRQSLRQGGYKWYYQAAQQALENDKREDALTNLAKARAFHTMPQAQDQIEKTIQERNKADELSVQAQAAIVVQDYQRALEIYQQAYKLNPADSSLAANIVQTSKLLCQRNLDQARQKYNSGDNVQAMQLLLECQKVDPNFTGSVELLAEIRNSLYLKQVRLGQEKLDQGLMGNAWLRGKVAYGFNAGPESQKILSQSQEILKQRLALKVGVARHTDANPTEGQIDDLVLAAVQKKTSNLAQIKSMDRDAASEDFGITVEWRLLNDDVDENTNTRKETSEYNNGKIRLDNPDYHKTRNELEQTTDDYEDAQKQYDRARDRWDQEQAAMSGMTDEEKKEYKKTHDTITKGSVDKYKNEMESQKREKDSARSKLNAMSPWIEEDDIRKWQYDVHTVTIKAEVEISMTFRDLKSGVILAQGRILGEDSDSDSYSVGDKFHNVPEDKLSISSDNQMKRNAVDKLAWKISELAASAHKQYLEQYLEKMEKARQQDNMDQAVEEAINYYFLNNSQFGAEVTKFLEDILGAEAGLSKWK